MDIQGLLEAVIAIISVIALLFIGCFVGRECGSYENFTLKILKKIEDKLKQAAGKDTVDIYLDNNYSGSMYCRFRGEEILDNEHISDYSLWGSMPLDDIPADKEWKSEMLFYRSKFIDSDMIIGDNQ